MTPNNETQVGRRCSEHLGPLLGPLAERLAGSQALTSQQQASIRQLGADAPATLTYAYGEENRIVFATNGEGTIASFLSGMLGMGGNAAGIGQFAAVRSAAQSLNVELTPVNVRDTDGHYHVPLVLSPFGYSTDRGS